MPVYFVQHGVAFDKSVDAKRSLSEQGRQYVNKIARHLANLNPGIEQVYHSGKLRSAETAQIFAECLNTPNVLQHELLNPNDDVNRLIPLLQENSMYVGHLPHMEKLVSCLLSGNENANIVQYENAAVARLSRGEGGYHLDWMLKPSVL